MTQATHKNLHQKHRAFLKQPQSKKALLSRFQKALPELIFRTTKLEGEPVTRKLIDSFFAAEK